MDCTWSAAKLQNYLQVIYKNAEQEDAQTLHEYFLVMLQVPYEPEQDTPEGYFTSTNLEDRVCRVFLMERFLNAAQIKKNPTNL